MPKYINSMSLLAKLERKSRNAQQTRTGLASIKMMPRKELEALAKRFKNEINRWVRSYYQSPNSRCHEVDERLANVVGKSLYPCRTKHKIPTSMFLRNCRKYVRRECRAGRLIDDLT
mgnify:CR=1 FL=1